MPPKKKAKKTQTVYLDKRAHAKLLRGRASAFELTIQIIFLLHSLNIRRMFYTTAYQGSNSGQILTKHASIAFTINQAEYLNGANVNHWMLTVSQICEKMTKIKYNITSQKKNGTYTYDNEIKLFLHVSKNKQNFFRYRNKEFAIRERLRRSAFVRLTLRALSKLYDFHFHFREMRKVFGNSKRMIQYEVYASMGVGRSYASMNGMTLQIKKILCQKCQLDVRNVSWTSKMSVERHQIRSHQIRRTDQIRSDQTVEKRTTSQKRESQKVTENIYSSAAKI